MVEYNMVYDVGHGGPDNEWRRNNLLAVRGCVEKETYHEVRFQWVDNTGSRPVQVSLTYRIVK